MDLYKCNSCGSVKAFFTQTILHDASIYFKKAKFLCRPKLSPAEEDERLLDTIMEKTSFKFPEKIVNSLEQIDKIIIKICNL